MDSASKSAQASMDFSQFGATERVPLSRVRQIAGPNLTRNWQTIPHVTSFEEADVTELESFRLQINTEQDEPKLTMLTFLIKAAAATLKRFAEFNASLDGQELVIKRYVHVGFAVDTPAGLLVPVIRDADKKGLLDIASDVAALSLKARQAKLSLEQMQGGSFSVSSLGGIAGTGFTPIINAPEVAILGAAKARIQPVWDGAKFGPRLLLPLSLSWDHRVVDGAAAARFLSHLATLLQDMLRTLE